MVVQCAPICKEGGNFDTIQQAKFNVEAYYSVVGMSHDLKRALELLEVLLPAFFSNAKSVFHEEIRFNKNVHAPIKNETLNLLIKKTLPFKWSLTFTIFSIKNLNYNMKNSSDNQCNKVGNLPIPEFIYTVCIISAICFFWSEKLKFVDSTDINC